MNRFDYGNHLRHGILAVSDRFQCIHWHSVLPVAQNTLHFVLLLLQAGLECTVDHGPSVPESVLRSLGSHDESTRPIRHAQHILQAAGRKLLSHLVVCLWEKLGWNSDGSDGYDSLRHDHLLVRWASVQQWSFDCQFLCLSPPCIHYLAVDRTRVQCFLLVGKRQAHLSSVHDYYGRHLGSLLRFHGSAQPDSKVRYVYRGSL